MATFAQQLWAHLKHDPDNFQQLGTIHDLIPKAVQEKKRYAHDHSSLLIIIPCCMYVIGYISNPLDCVETKALK